jgi:crotonobetainyl-CoA:carnitine CoA-transferase CaiB-like acyl-CoA transferase
MLTSYRRQPGKPGSARGGRIDIRTNGAAAGPPDAPLPLDGIVVVDFSTTLPGPYCSSLLTRLGASVTCLEPPGGDALRTAQPMAYEFVGRGKRSAVVNLKDEASRAMALDLIDGADVVLEGWRPGVADRLGVGPEVCMRRNRRLVYCSVSGYGATSPLASRPGHDLNFVAEAGAVDLCATAGFPVADLSAGMMAAIRVLAAVVRARETGTGAFVDVSAVGAVRDWVNAIGGARAQEFVAGIARMPQYGVFVTADGDRLALGVAGEDHLWHALITALGRPEWGRLTAAQRFDQHEEIHSYLRQEVSRRTSAQLRAALSAVDTCWNFLRLPGDDIPISGELPMAAQPAPQLDAHCLSVRRQNRDS